MFEKSTWIRLPRNVVVGHGVVARVGEAIAETHLGGRPLVVTSPTPREVAGEQVVTQLRERGPNPELVVVEEATFDAVERVLGRVDATGTGYLVGVGGGKAIDITKMAASERKLGFVSVPTAASHDGIVSNRGSVPEGDTRHSVAARPPLAVVADTAVLADAPWRLTTAGCADIISNYTAVRDWQLAHPRDHAVTNDHVAWQPYPRRLLEHTQHWQGHKHKLPLCASPDIHSTPAGPDGGSHMVCTSNTRPVQTGGPLRPTPRLRASRLCPGSGRQRRGGPRTRQ
jgi:glycerol dehydrogenase-like iron-containing ADH family enzyme